MGSCQICGASGIGLKTNNCKVCGKQLCLNHSYAIPEVVEQQLIDALQGRGGFLAKNTNPQMAMLWMSNPRQSPKEWQRWRIFCGAPCASSFVGTLTPNKIPGPDGKEIVLLTYMDTGNAAGQMQGFAVDYTKSVGQQSLVAFVEANLPAEVQPAFRRRAMGSDLVEYELRRAKTAWESGNFELAAQIYDYLSMPEYAAKARELGKTSHVVTTNITVNYNQLMEQLKELRRPIAYSCPKCGAGHTFDSNTPMDRFKCAYCGTSFAIPDLQKAVGDMLGRMPAAGGPPPPPSNG